MERYYVHVQTGHVAMVTDHGYSVGGPVTFDPRGKLKGWALIDEGRYLELAAAKAEASAAAVAEWAEGNDKPDKK